MALICLSKNYEKKFNRGDIGVISEDKEKHVSFNVKLARVRNEDRKEICKNIQLRFIDSFRFVASNLDKLASNLDDDQCKHLMEFYNEEEVFRLMRRKGVYPKEYIMVGINLRGQVCRSRMRFIASLIRKVSVTKIMSMQSKFGISRGKKL